MGLGPSEPSWNPQSQISSAMSSANSLLVNSSYSRNESIFFPEDNGPLRNQKTPEPLGTAV